MRKHINTVSEVGYVKGQSGMVDMDDKKYEQIQKLCAKYGMEFGTKEESFVSYEKGQESKYKQPKLYLVYKTNEPRYAKVTLFIDKFSSEITGARPKDIYELIKQAQVVDKFFKELEKIAPENIMT